MLGLGMQKLDRMTLGARYPLTISEIAGRGRCLVTLTDIPAGAIIEIAPVQVLPPPMAVVINSYKLDYFLYWENSEIGKTLSIPLGLLGLCNHSDRPNAVLAAAPERRLVRLSAARDIACGEEITVTYRDPSRSYCVFGNVE
jgi:hypothetical protein